jgi:branched-subunit amino acid aminotransferase/4-amino-4-deoxychorismate lyase
MPETASNDIKSKIFDYVVVNGERLLAEKAQTSLFDHAFLASYGVYETAKIDQGRPFYLEDHLRRLLRSAQLIEIKIEADVATLTSWFNLLIEVDPGATWGLKILVLGAVAKETRPVIALQANPLPRYPEQLYRDGAPAVLYEGLRAVPTCKSLNTLVPHMARQKASRAGALEGLLHYAGYLTEGSRSSLFVVRQGQLTTAPQATVLPGITRDLILQVMRDSPYPVAEAPIPVDLAQFDEAFISSTSMHVMPIIRLENQPVGDGQVGPITRTVMARFNSFYDQVMAETSSQPPK